MKIRSGILRILAVGVFIAGLGLLRAGGSRSSLSTQPLAIAVMSMETLPSSAAGLDLATVDNAWFSMAPRRQAIINSNAMGDPTLFTFSLRH